MMHKTAFAIKTLEDYFFLKECGVKNIVCGGKQFSRLGEFNNDELLSIIADAKKTRISVQLECDVFPTQKQFESLTESWKSWHISSEDVILRVLDLGLLDWFSQQSYKIVPLLESGFHNKVAISEVQSSYEHSIAHYVLSKEIPFKIQQDYTKTLLNKDIELNILAPLLLLYTPRKLLEPHIPLNSSYRQTVAASEESVHRGFVVRENQWGTLFFHPKHQSLLSRWEILQNFEKACFLVDLRLIESSVLRHQIFQELTNFLDNKISLEKLEQFLQRDFPYPTTRGFFDVNKTDVLFPKLKNQFQHHPEFLKVAEVMDYIKGEALVVKVAEGEQLKISDKLLLQSPQGKQGIVELTKLADLAGQPISTAHSDEVVRMNFLKHFPSQSTIFKIHDRIIP